MDCGLIVRNTCCSGYEVLAPLYRSSSNIWSKGGALTPSLYLSCDGCIVGQSIRRFEVGNSGRMVMGPGSEGRGGRLQLRYPHA